MTVEVISDSESLDRERFEAILSSAEESLQDEDEVLSCISELPQILSDRGKDVDLRHITALSGFVLENFSEEWRERGLYNLQKNIDFREGGTKDLREMDFENIIKDYAGTKLAMAMKPLLEEYEGSFKPLQNYLEYKVDSAIDPVIDEIRDKYGEMFEEIKERQEDFNKMYF